MSIKISVITPSYNQAAYLERTLRSILDQRDLIHEFFVLDGGSDDGSVEIIKKYAGSIDHWVSEPDKGQGDAIHRGFCMATGDVLYWLNSDDVLLPKAMESVHATFSAHPQLEVVTGYGVAIDSEDRIVQMRRQVHDSLTWAQLGFLRIHQPCCFFRRETYEGSGGLDLDLHCVLDTDLWYKFFTQKARFGGIDAYVAAYRIHPEAKGSTLHERYRKERLLMRQRYPHLCNRPLPHALGRIAYYGSQLTSGRTAASVRDMRHRGKKLQEVFSDGSVAN